MLVESPDSIEETVEFIHQIEDSSVGTVTAHLSDSEEDKMFSTAPTAEKTEPAVLRYYGRDGHVHLIKQISCSPAYDQHEIPHRTVSVPIFHPVDQLRTVQYLLLTAYDDCGKQLTDVARPRNTIFDGKNNASSAELRYTRDRAKNSGDIRENFQQHHTSESPGH